MAVRMRKPKAIILDIEGTTTSVRFVAEVLFPYIRTHLKKFLNERWGQPELMLTIDRLRMQARIDHEKGVRVPSVLDDRADQELIKRSVIANVLWQMDEKKNNAALKQIQILVWVFGYEKANIKGHVFDDVPPCLHYWKRELHIRLFLYSTGMIIVQQLLFACSTHGNLLPLIDDCFDVLIGSKRDPRSFYKISGLIEEQPHDILFLTDSGREARAAMQAGCRALLVSRPGNRLSGRYSSKEFRTISSFTEIIFE
ncbi:enolase-phosphatase E1-like [Brevipalpus obovatus]|uniref:enolase-phosphatase E1-like n=1 Tax=Brevipalpus obovatus TaxID=246614 RepID=UPI003D9F4238